MKRPLVSVVVPVYNIEKYIEKCLVSLIAQSYLNIEIVIVDDGSTDGSREICDKIASKDKRVKVFHKKNGGLSDARNYGIRKARGDLVMLVDGDDYVERDFVGAMWQEMQKTGADIVICGYNDVIPRKHSMSGVGAATKFLVEQENLEIVAWNKLYRKSLFSTIKYPVGEVNEDSLTTYKLLAEAKIVAYVDKSLYRYVEREDSIMAVEKVERRLYNREKAAREAISYFAGNKELENAADIALLTAKFAFIDNAIRGIIPKKYYDENLKWIKVHGATYRTNIFMSKKLKIYILLCFLGLYRVFRKVI